MTAALIEFLLGVYFFVVSISMTRREPSGYDTRVDFVKLVFGIVLIILAVMQGVRVI